MNLPFTDGFDGSGSLGADWSTPSGLSFTAFARSSGLATADGPSNHASYVNTAFTGAVEVEVTAYRAAGGSTAAYGIYLTTASTGLTGYMVGIVSGVFGVFKHSSGTFTPIFTYDGSYDTTTPRRFRAEFQPGGYFKAFLDGVPLVTTSGAVAVIDTTYSPVYVGLIGYGGDEEAAFFDDFLYNRLSARAGKGSKSSLVYRGEATYATLIGDTENYGISFSAEQFSENIAAIQSGDIRSDRTRSAIRGGNVTPDGGWSGELAPARYVTMFRHLLAAEALSGGNNSVTTPGDFEADATASQVNRGDYFQFDNGAGVVATVVALTWWSSIDSFSASEYAALITNASVGDKVTYKTSKVQILSKSLVDIRTLTFVPGVDWPATGLAFEKHVKGGLKDLFIAYKGARVDSVDISIPQSGMVTANFTVYATETVPSTVSSPNGFLEADLVSPSDTQFIGQETVLELNDAKAASASNNASFRIGNNTDAQINIHGDRFRFDICEGTRTAEGSFTVYFRDLTEYNLFKNETKIPISFTFISAGRLMKIRFPECKIAGQGTPSIQGAGTVTANFSFTVFRQSATQDIEMTVVLKSDDTFYNA